MVLASIGSFLNVVIDRLPLNQNLVKGRSYCDHCHRNLELWEMIPVFSYFLLGGKCRTCRRQLSIQYPFIEIFTALLLVLYVWQAILPLIAMGLPTGALLIELIHQMAVFILIGSLIVVALIDVKHGIIPDEIIFFLISVFAVWKVILLFIGITFHSITIADWAGGVLTAVGVGVGAALFFYLLILITKGKGMGGGDVKLAFVLGLFLGLSGTFLGIYIAFLSGAVFGVLMIALGRKKFGQTIAFGPFLALGAWMSVFLGSWILSGFGA